MKKHIIFLVLIFIFFFSCKKSEEMSDLEKLRKSNNRTSYPVNKMDSAQAIQFITKQKIQELLDLSALYSNGNRDTEIDSVIYAQMKGYFSEPDSTKLTSIITQLDSLKVNSAKVGNLKVEKKIVGLDTIELAHFDVEYYDKSNKLIGNFNKTAQYQLKKSSNFQKEFKFYFQDFDVKFPKDSTSVGVTK